MVLCDSPGFLPWLGRLGGCWSYYFNASPLQKNILRLAGPVGRWVFFALFDLLSLPKTVYYWIAIVGAPSVCTDRLVQQTIDLNYLTGYSRWNRITVPRILEHGLSTPTSLVWGEVDHICDSDHGSYVAGLLGLDYFFVPDAGHAVTADVPKFLDTLKKALASTKTVMPASRSKIEQVDECIVDSHYSSSYAKDRTERNTASLHQRLKAISGQYGVAQGGPTNTLTMSTKLIASESFVRTPSSVGDVESAPMLPHRAAVSLARGVPAPITDDGDPVPLALLHKFANLEHHTEL
jgi:hypothetical protein